MFKKYSQALLAATYENGQPPKMTAQHKQAEFHRFKTDYLFKEKIIPKHLYIARLFQHFLIIQALEAQLKNLSQTQKSDINAFFSLAYLNDLWRTEGIEKDLQQLGFNIHENHQHEIAKTTQKYLKSIKGLSPKTLLSHFLLHVAGFMHGGDIICSKYILPSNQLTTYQITTHQYNFSAISQHLFNKKISPMKVYQAMMEELDTIALTEDEYQTILKECINVYTIMTSIYDDLCHMYTDQPQLNYTLAIMAISMIALAAILKVFANVFSENNDERHLSII